MLSSDDEMGFVTGGPLTNDFPTPFFACRLVNAAVFYQITNGKLEG